MARRFLMGNEAFAHAALKAGCGLFAGYPGTPSSEVIETVARLHKDGVAKGIHVEWSTNEKAALEVAAASALSGVRSLVTCKQVGLNVASDALMSLNYLGVKGGLVILVADDPGPISSQTEQDTRRFAAFAKVPVLDPATPEQGAEMIIQAFALSERYHTPVIFRPTTRIDHASTFFEFPSQTEPKPAQGGGFQRDPEEYVIFPPRAFQAHGEINERLRAIAFDYTFTPELAEFNQLFASVGGGPLIRVPGEEQMEANLPPAKLGIVCGGVSTQYAREALQLLQQQATAAGRELPPVRLLQLGTPYPFPHRTASRALKDLTDVLVLEELDSVIEEELQKMASISFLWPRIHGKLTDDANARGENSTEDALGRISAFFAKCAGLAGPEERAAQEAAQEGVATESAEGMPQPSSASSQDLSIFHYPGPLPARPAVLCAGCPHRASFLAVKRALKQLDIPRDDAVFCGDIGCYTLGNAAPLDAVDTCLCMGGGITMAQGISAVNAGKKAIAFVGDSTFFASGITGVVNAAYNNHDVTVCVLDNSTTAMTGMQPHPGTGLTLMGDENQPVSIKALLEAANITSIVEVDPLQPEAAEELVAQALAFEGPSAVIFQSPCIWTKPFGIPAKVSTAQCTGCKKCITQTGCPAIGFSPDAHGPKSGRRGQAVIDRTQCTGCGLCLPVCPTHAIALTPEVEPKPVRQSRLNRTAAPSEGEGLGEPVAERLRNEERDADAGEEVRDQAGEGLAEEATEEQGSAQPDLPFDLDQEGFSLLAPLYGTYDDFEDDDLYDDMIGTSRRRSYGGRRREKGQRRYFMKEPSQRGVPAERFVKTSAGEASQTTQIELTAPPALQPSAFQAEVLASVDAAVDEEDDEGKPSQPRRSKGPDYGGNSQLKLSDLLGSGDISLPADGDSSQGQSAAMDGGSIQITLSDEEEPRSSRRLRRVRPDEPEEQRPAQPRVPAEAEPDEDSEPQPLPKAQRSVAKLPQKPKRPGAPRSEAARSVTSASGTSSSGAPASAAPRSVRSKFADYGKVKQVRNDLHSSGSGQGGAQ